MTAPRSSHTAPRHRSFPAGLVVVVALAVFAAFSAPRMELGRVLALVTAPAPQSQGTTLGQFWSRIATRTDLSDMPEIDPDALPAFHRLERETVIERRLDPETLKPVARETQRIWLVNPVGYLLEVGERMLETVEIAIWGTALALAIGMPLALVRSAPLSMPEPLRWMARTACAALRSLPELLVALILVGIVGFGPPAGVLALGFHAAGFIGRFHADAIEDADQRPVQALHAAGAGRLAVFWLAILPQVRASLASSTLYILDRNVRMATVIGIVGAGGIGQELKGRIDLYDYGHAATIVIAIFLVVAALDEIAARLRPKH